MNSGIQTTSNSTTDSVAQKFPSTAEFLNPTNEAVCYSLSAVYAAQNQHQQINQLSQFLEQQQKQLYTQHFGISDPLNNVYYYQTHPMALVSHPNAVGNGQRANGQNVPTAVAKASGAINSHHNGKQLLGQTSNVVSFLV